QKPLMRAIAIGVAIVPIVRSRTTSGEFLPAGRLRKLPDDCARDAAGGRCRRVLALDAPRRRRTGIVVNPVAQLPVSDVILDVLCRGDANSLALADLHSRAIHARAKVNAAQFIHPPMQVSMERR